MIYSWKIAIQNGLATDFPYLNQPLFFRLLSEKIFCQLPIIMSFASEWQERFWAISRAVNSVLMILEEIKEDIDSIYLKSFKQSEDIIE